MPHIYVYKYTYLESSLKQAQTEPVHARTVEDAQRNAVLREGGRQFQSRQHRKQWDLMRGIDWQTRAGKESIMSNTVNEQHTNTW